MKNSSFCVYILLSVCERERDGKKEKRIFAIPSKDKPGELSITHENVLAGHQIPSLALFLSAGDLGGPFISAEQLSRAPPHTPHLQFLSSPFVWRNLKQSDTDGDKHRGMLRDRGLAGKPARHLLIQL